MKAAMQVAAAVHQLAGPDDPRLHQVDFTPFLPEQFGLSRHMVLDRSADYLAWVQQRCGELVDVAAAT